MPPLSSKLTSGARSLRRGLSLPPSTNDGGDFHADENSSGDVGAGDDESSLLESQPSSPNVLCGCIIVTERGGLRAVVDRPSVDTGYRLSRHRASSDGSPTQTASSPPCLTQRTSGAQSSGRGHSLPPSTNDGGDFNADYDPSHVGTCERSGSSFEHVIAFSSSDDIAFSLPPTLHH